MSGDQIILNYNGPVTLETTEVLLEKAKNNLDSHDIKKVFKKRIFTVLDECIENILRYQAKAESAPVQPYIKLEKEGLEYRITAGNPILKSDITGLVEKLKKITDSDKEALQNMYEEQINTETDLNKNSAGLGLLIIAQKADNPIQYSLTTISETYSIIELCVSISVNNIK